MCDMKNSGIEWIGEMPDDWATEQVGRLADQIKLKNVGMIETNLLSLSYGKVKRRDIDATGGLLPESFEGYNVIEENDIVLRFTDLQNDQKSLRVGRATERGIITSAYTTIRLFDSKDSEFLYYALHSYDLKKGFYGMGTGVRQGLRWQEAKYIEIPWPNAQTRMSICRFLDSKCSEIDEAIEAAKASIEEYKLYKKAVILQVVTNGLDHNVVMKDSGIEHLGSIPVHWSVRPVKSLMSFSKGINILKTDLCDEGEPCVTYGEAHGRLAFSFDVDRNYIRRAPLRFTVGGEKSIVYTGDFIFADTSEDIAGSGDFTFNAGKKPVFAGYHSVVARNIFPDQFDSLFLAFLFDSLPFRYQIQKRVGGVKVYSINARNIGSALAWIPPIEEQIKISRYLEQVRSNLDMAIQTKSKIIEELKAYKKSLIWETVTGKREVPCL